jgi:hypothetical protein
VNKIIAFGQILRLVNERGRTRICHSNGASPNGSLPWHIIASKIDRGGTVYKLACRAAQQNPQSDAEKCRPEKIQSIHRR